MTTCVVAFLKDAAVAATTLLYYHNIITLLGQLLYHYLKGRYYYCTRINIIVRVECQEMTY